MFQRICRSRNHLLWKMISIRELISGTTKVRNSGLGPDPDLSAKSGPELVTRSGVLLGCLWYDLINTYHMICGSYCSAEESKR